MNENERTAHIKRVCATLHIRSLEEYRRNLEELRKSWENALKRHEARRPGMMLRVFTNDRAYKDWSDKRDTLFKNLSSCIRRIQELSTVIAAGGDSPEVSGYVDSLLSGVLAGDSNFNNSVERSALQASRPA